MATIAAPYGVQPISHTSGTPREQRMANGIASGTSGNIFKFQPITLVAGLIVPVTLTTQKIFGIFMGVEFTPSGGRPAVSPYWPSGQTYTTTDWMNVYYVPAWDPNLRFQVQADGSVAQASMGAQFNIASVAGNTTTGLSAASVSATPVSTSSQGQFFLHEFFPGVNDPVNGGDAFTDLIVGIAYPQESGFQTSI